MHTNLNTRTRKLSLRFLSVVIILILCTMAIGSPVAFAQTGGTPQWSTESTVSTFLLSNGELINRHIINGPLVPPPGFETERQAVALPKSNGTTANAISLPGSHWLVSCATGAATEIASLY